MCNNSDTLVHVTSRIDIFHSYTQGEFGDVKLAHQDVLKCIGLGDVDLEYQISSQGCEACSWHSVEFNFSC